EQRECGDNECVSGITVMLQAPVHLRSGHGPLTLPAPPCFSELVRKAKPNLLAPQADGSTSRGQTHTHTHTHTLSRTQTKTQISFYCHPNIKTIEPHKSLDCNKL